MSTLATVQLQPWRPTWCYVACLIQTRGGRPVSAYELMVKSRFSSIPTDWSGSFIVSAQLYSSLADLGHGNGIRRKQLLNIMSIVQSFNVYFAKVRQKEVGYAEPLQP